MLAVAVSLAALSFSPALPARPAVAGRAAEVSMQVNKKLISFDDYGVFEGREVAVQKAPVRLLSRLEELRLLTQLSKLGVLSKAEEAGVFSSLEKAGAFSLAEKLLPIADDLKLLSTAESLLNVEANLIFVSGVVLLLAEAGLIAVVPDDNAALIAIQALTGLAAGAGAVTAFGAAFLFSLLQGEK